MTFVQVALLVFVLAVGIKTVMTVTGALSSYRRDRERFEAENDALRGIIAKGHGPCVYCHLSADDIAKCASGFPGCARMDDIMAVPIHEAEIERDQAINERDLVRVASLKALTALTTIAGMSDPPASKIAALAISEMNEKLAEAGVGVKLPPSFEEASVGRR